MIRYPQHHPPIHGTHNSAAEPKLLQKHCAIPGDSTGHGQPWCPQPPFVQQTLLWSFDGSYEPACWCRVPVNHYGKPCRPTPPYFAQLQCLCPPKAWCWFRLRYAWCEILSACTRVNSSHNGRILLRNWCLSNATKKYLWDCSKQHANVLLCSAL